MCLLLSRLIDHNYAVPETEEHSSFPQTQNKLQSLGDLFIYISELCNRENCCQNFIQYLAFILYICHSSVDLIMWRDISRSAFIFGIGTFIIVSSSYAKDINLRLEIYTTKIILYIHTSAILEASTALTLLDPCLCSLISVTSYVGLVYLAVIFLYRSLICR